MYRKALSAFRNNLPLFFVCACVLTILEEFGSRGARIGGGLVLTGMLAFYSHRPLYTTVEVVEGADL